MNYSMMKQSVILCLENGEQISDEMNCFVITIDGVGKIQFPRTIQRTLGGIKRDFRLFKYSEKNNIVFYKLVS